MLRRDRSSTPSKLLRLGFRELPSTTPFQSVADGCLHNRRRTTQFVDRILIIVRFVDSTLFPSVSNLYINLFEKLIATMTTDVKSIEVEDKPKFLATKPSYEVKDELVDDTGSGASSISDSSASDHSLGLTSTKSREEKVAEAHTTYYPHPTSFKLSDHPIDDYRELRVAIVGAGLSGISAGALLPVKVPGIKLTIFEKNADVVSLYAVNT